MLGTHTGKACIVKDWKPKQGLPANGPSVLARQKHWTRGPALNDRYRPSGRTHSKKDRKINYKPRNACCNTR